MSLSSEEVRRAFREVALREYADVPPAEEIDHVFSPRFLSFMAKLIQEEKRGSWRLLSRQRRRVLVVAAILALSLLLVACTPTWREAVTQLIVTVYERLVDYSSNGDGREEIETIYGLDQVPEGFVLVSQTQHSSSFVETIYQNNQEKLLVLKQWAVSNLEGTVDNERGDTAVLTIGEEELSVLVYTTETLCTATWSYDGYVLKISSYVPLSHDELIILVLSLSPVDAAPPVE